MNIRCQTLPVEAVSPTDRTAMWRLFDHYYTGIDSQIFLTDFDAKDLAILLWRDDHLTGFTSLRFAEVDAQRVLYSGDIVIDQNARDIGTAYFFHHWARAVWQKCDWWCYLASGARTYRIPHTFYKRVVPHAALQETDQEQAYKHSFAKHAYGSGYEPKRGIVKLEHPYRLRASIPDTRNNYPMDSFFQQQNPNWKQGEELVSLISLKAENWNAAALRMSNWKLPNA